jgi:hypothetical protein
MNNGLRAIQPPKMVRKSAMSPLPEHFSMSLGLLADALGKVGFSGNG